MKDKIIAEKNKELEIKNNNISSLSQELNTIKFYKNYKLQEESFEKNKRETTTLPFLCSFLKSSLREWPSYMFPF